MKLSSIIGVSAILLMLGSGTGLAQTPAPATPAPDASAPAGPEAKGIAKECSQQASAKGLHGKDRRKFRAECKKTGGKPG